MQPPVETDVSTKERAYGRFLRIIVSFNGRPETVLGLVAIEDTPMKTEAWAEKEAREVAQGMIDACIEKCRRDRLELRKLFTPGLGGCGLPIPSGFRIEVRNCQMWLLDRIRYLETVRKAKHETN